MNAEPTSQSSVQPLGTTGDLRCRLLLHHVPLAFASVVVLVLLMSLPLPPHADILSGVFPQARGRMDHGGGETMDHGDSQTAPGNHGGGRTMDHGDGQNGEQRHDGGHGGQTSHGAQTGRMRHDGEQTGQMAHGSGQTGPTDHSGGQAEPTAHGGEQATAVGHGEQTGRTDHGGDQATSTDHGGGQHSPFIRQFTVATGYLALGLVAVTLLIGPANLLLRKRTPVSNYLSRDVGTWAAIGGVVHTIFGLQVHGSGRIRDFLDFFIAPDGNPLLNSFGLGNWTGLAALVIVVELFAISSDAALRKLKASKWKRLQRLNYALFALVILHAFFYGALLRVTSTFTLLLGLSVLAVFVGQTVGIWLWRRRHSRAEATVA